MQIDIHVHVLCYVSHNLHCTLSIDITEIISQESVSLWSAMLSRIDDSFLATWARVDRGILLHILPMVSPRSTEETL